MPRARRFAVVAVLALVGALALTGCGRAQPGTAAYVGGTRYTERQLDDLVAEIQLSSPDTLAADARSWALTRLVIGDLGRRAADHRSIPIPQPKYEETALGLNRPTDSKLVQLRAEFNALTEGLLKFAEPIPPTDQDLHEIWDSLRHDNLTYEEAVVVLRADQTLRLALGVRKLLREEAEQTKVVVNPVYQPLIVNFGLNEIPVEMLVGDGAGYVSDVTNG